MHVRMYIGDSTRNHLKLESKHAADILIHKKLALEHSFEFGNSLDLE